RGNRIVRRRRCSSAASPAPTAAAIGQLAAPGLTDQRRQQLTTQRDAKQAELTEANAPYVDRDRLRGEVQTLEQQLRAAQGRGDQAAVDRINGQLAPKRTQLAD